MGRSQTTFVDGAKWFGRRVRSKKQQESGWEEGEEEREEKTRRGNHGQRPVAVSRPSPWCGKLVYNKYLISSLFFPSKSSYRLSHCSSYAYTGLSRSKSWRIWGRSSCLWLLNLGATASSFPSPCFRFTPHLRMIVWSPKFLMWIPTTWFSFSWTVFAGVFSGSWPARRQDVSTGCSKAERWHAHFWGSRCYQSWLLYFILSTPDQSFLQNLNFYSVTRFQIDWMFCWLRKQ